MRRRRFLLVPAVLLVLIAGYLVWSSSPTVPLILSRQQAIERAALSAMVNGTVAWTRVESKLIRYEEWRRLFAPTPGLGYTDTTDANALLWVVAYRGPMPAISVDYCVWAFEVFPADARMPRDWGATECGPEGWPMTFDLLPDLAWWRLSY
jgi:hypothetical protein